MATSDRHVTSSEDTASSHVQPYARVRKENVCTEKLVLFEGHACDTDL